MNSHKISNHNFFLKKLNNNSTNHESIQLYATLFKQTYTISYQIFIDYKMNIAGSVKRYIIFNSTY